MKSHFRLFFHNIYKYKCNYLRESLSKHKLNRSVVFGLISFSTLAVIFGVYVTSASIAFAYVCNPSENTPKGKTVCCGESHGKDYCTECDDTQPPSNCSPRYEVPRTAGETAPPTNLAPPKVCPDGSSPDANGVCPPVTQGTPPLPPPKGTTGAIEQPPTNLASPSTSKITCPDGSSPNANDVCPQVNQGSSSSSSSSTDNTPKQHKGSELSQLPPPTSGNTSP
jgi:hypothetical protein